MANDKRFNAKNGLSVGAAVNVVDSNGNITANTISVGGVSLNTSTYPGTANNANNLSGQPGSYYAANSQLASYALLASPSFTGTLSAADVSISGNLTVSGTTTYINTQTLNVGDNIITLNADLPGATAPSENAGIEVNRGSSANVQFMWDETNDRWSTNGQPLAVSSLIAAGSASGITTLAAGNTTITGFANIISDSAVLRVGNATSFSTSNTSGHYPASNTLGSALGATTQRWVLNATTGSFAGAVSGITTLATGNTTITGFANVTSSIQGGGSLTIAGAASGITTLAAGNTTITGFVNATSSVNAASHTVGTNFIANTTAVVATGYVNVASDSASIRIGNSTVFTTSNSTVYSGTALSANNADYLDGQHGSYYAANSQLASYALLSGATFTGAVTFNANATLGAADHLILSSTSGISANGTYGTAGHVLHSNGTAVYWDTDNDGVTSVATGNGLTGGTITTTGTVSVLANNGITANSTGVFAKAANGTSVDASGINVTGGSGLVSNTTGVHVGAGSGIIVNADDVAVDAGTGIVANATGVHVNSSYIATVSANNATYFDGATWAEPKALGGTTANSGAFTTVTTSANANFDAGTLFVDATNNRVGVGNTTPTQALHVQGTALATADFRAPFFYDSTDTSYYLRPATAATNGSVVSGSRVKDLRFDTLWQGVPAHAGPILTYTLTSGGTGYTDGSYTNIVISGGQGVYATFDFTVSGGIVTVATLTEGGSGFQVDNTLSIPALGGTGSGGVITVNTVRSVELSLYNTAAKLRLGSSATALTAGQEIGGIYFNTRDASAGGGGDKARILGAAEGTSGGGKIQFYTSINGGSPTLCTEMGGSNDFRIYNANGTFYTALTAPVSANRSVVFPDAAGTVALTTSNITGSANNATYLNGQLASFYTNASNISTGTLAAARLPSLYLGTTTIQSTSAAQAVSGITTLATGNTTITGFANVSTTLQVAGISTFNANVTLNAADHLILSSTSGISANGTFGTAGQSLTSNGTAVYWATPTGGITGVTAGDGLTGGGSSGSVTLNVGAGTGITVAADAISVNASYIATISSNNASFLGGTAASSYALKSGTTFTGLVTFDGVVSTSQTASMSTGLYITNTSNTSGLTFAAGSGGGIAIDYSSNTTVGYGRLIMGGFSGLQIYGGNTTAITPTNLLVTIANTGSVNAAAYTVASTVVANSSGTYATHLGGTAAANYMTNTASYTISGVHTHNANVVIAGTTNLVLNSGAGIYANGALGGASQVLTSNSTGGTYWSTPAAGGVTSITGTANQVIASGSTGAVTLSTPQSIGTASSVQFGSFGVGTAASGITGEIRATNNITAYFASDRRLKENIQPVSDALTKLQDISGVTFEWTDEEIERRGGEDGYFVRKNDVGVIAQEIEAILPEAVATRPDGYKAVRYELIIPLLIESIKDQQKQIDEQDTKINTLESKMNEILTLLGDK